MELIITVIIVLIAGGLTLLIWKYSSRVKRHHIVEANDNMKAGVKKRQALILKIIVVIVVCSITLFLTKTQIKKVGKNAYINNFEEFVEKVKVNHKEYSADDWIKIDKEYQEFEEEDRIKYEKFFTKEDKTRVNTLDGEYSSYKAKGVVDSIYDTIKDGVNNAVEYIDGMIKGLNNITNSDTIDE
jgi:heme/copper-type cytochrome/quinol oxidase subunit 2